jgi:hypothetical protein
MDTPQEGPDEAKVGSADAKVRAAAVIGAWACIGIAAIVAALSFLF